MKKKALIIIDVQNGMFLDEYKVYNSRQLLQNLKSLLIQARSTNTPIYYVQHNEAVGDILEHGSKNWEIHPDIAPRESDIIIQKTTPNSFLHTSLDEELKNQGVEHLIITGIQTEICVDTTCRSAVGMGYQVTLVSDAHSTWDSDELTARQIISHHNIVLRWFADITPSREIKF